MEQALELGDEAVDFKFEMYSRIERIVVFSDSLFAFTKDDTAQDLSKICQFANTVFKIFMKEGLPLRGAIAHGETIVDPEHSLYLGDGIVKAYLLEEQLKIVGVVLHPDLNPENPHETAELEVALKDDKSQKLRIPVIGSTILFPAEAAPAFLKLARLAGESERQRYVNSEAIVAAMCTWEAKNFRVP